MKLKRKSEKRKEIYCEGNALDIPAKTPKNEI